MEWLQVYGAGVEGGGGQGDAQGKGVLDDGDDDGDGDATVGEGGKLMKMRDFEDFEREIQRDAPLQAWECSEGGHRIRVAVEHDGERYEVHYVQRVNRPNRRIVIYRGGDLLAVAGVSPGEPLYVARGKWTPEWFDEGYVKRLMKLALLQCSD